MKLGSTFYVGSQEQDAIALDVRESEKYVSLRGLLEDDDKQAFRCDNSAVGTPLYPVDPTLTEYAVAHLTVVSHTHEYTPGDRYTYSYCACGLSCNHSSFGHKNGVCTNCHVACPHPNDERDDETYTCNYCGANLAASVSDGETTTYYVGLADALNAAGAKTSGLCTVKLLRDTYMWAINSMGVPLFLTTTGVKINGGAEVWLDLNRHTVTGGNSSDTPTMLNVKAGTLKVTDERARVRSTGP